VTRELSPNERDNKELAKRLQNPEFQVLCHQLVKLRMTLQDDMLITAQTPTAQQLNDG